jgi:Transglutaminase-like superfamily
MKSRAMRRVYLSEAAIMLLLARLAVRFVPPARIFVWARRSPRRICRFAGAEVSWISWAVESVGASTWMSAACLPRALAAQAMLRRRGIASRLCLGVAREGDALLAHAWVEIGKDKIIGGAAAGAFTRLAEFGGAC